MESTTSCTETSGDEVVIKTEPETTYSCDYEDCFAVFTKLRKLVNHQRKHAEERPYVCDAIGCSKSYTNTSHLRRHKKVSHETEKVRVKCEVETCGKEFYDSYGLKRHIYRTHNPDRKYAFTCFECKQGFHRKRELQQHSYLHTGQLTFKCSICETKFPSHRECVRHKRTHTIYTCECRETFERWSQLQKHLKICPRKVVDNTCAVCNKQFSTKTNLNVHKKTHLDHEKKDIYKCPRPDCDNFYFYKKNLVQHIRTKHDNIKKKIPCPIEGCDRTLSKMQNLKVHLEVHKHGIRRKLIRNPRKDKGIPRKKIALELAGVASDQATPDTTIELSSTDTCDDEAIAIGSAKTNDEHVIDDDKVIIKEEIEDNDNQPNLQSNINEESEQGTNRESTSKDYFKETFTEVQCEIK